MLVESKPVSEEDKTWLPADVVEWPFVACRFKCKLLESAPRYNCNQSINRLHVIDAKG